jgi:hypothetical protein
MPTILAIKTLFAVSGNRCAFPRCEQRMSTPSAILGELCHIRASSPNGPRFDPAQSEASRDSVENLILLCPTHHKMVDSDVATFTVERLESIKRQHEAAATERVSVADYLIRDWLRPTAGATVGAALGAIASTWVALRLESKSHETRDPLPPRGPFPNKSVRRRRQWLGARAERTLRMTSNRGTISGQDVEMLLRAFSLIADDWGLDPIERQGLLGYRTDRELDGTNLVEGIRVSLDVRTRLELVFDIAVFLERLYGSEKVGIRRWLRTDELLFDQRKPIEVMLHGNIIELGCVHAYLAASR